MKQSEFFGQYAPIAIQEQKRTGIPASIILAQAALESGWGESGLTQKALNFFGIKASGDWEGRTYLSPTTEVKGGIPVVEMGTFRAYENVSQSFADHSDFLLENKRYQKALATSDPMKFAEELQAAGYATDPLYASKLKNMITQYELTKFDTPEGEAAPDPGYGSSIDQSGSAGSWWDRATGKEFFSSLATNTLTGVAIIAVVLVIGVIGFQALKGGTTT